LCEQKIQSLDWHSLSVEPESLCVGHSNSETQRIDMLLGSVLLQPAYAVWNILGQLPWWNIDRRILQRENRELWEVVGHSDHGF
jgi:hypothetical protein